MRFLAEIWTCRSQSPWPLRPGIKFLQLKSSHLRPKFNLVRLQAEVVHHQLLPRELVFDVGHVRDVLVEVVGREGRHQLRNLVHFVLHRQGLRLHVLVPVLLDVFSVGERSADVGLGVVGVAVAADEVVGDVEGLLAGKLAGDPVLRRSSSDSERGRILTSGHFEFSSILEDGLKVRLLSISRS